MIDIFFAAPRSYKRFNSEASMKHERDLLDLAMGMAYPSQQQQTSFPKHNVYQMLDGSPYTYFMEFALAGYDKDSLDVTLLSSGHLLVSSKTNSERKEERSYIHRGMARRDFSTKFYVGKDVEVRNATFTDGLLTVELEKLVPEEQKPRSVEIR
jgi:molecular chaperone IbpA